MSTQAKKRLALQINFTKRLCKVRENKIYGIPKSLVIWVSLSNMASYWIGQQEKYLSSFIDRKLSNEYSGKKRLALQITFTKRLCKVRENKIYGIPKSLVIWVSLSNMASYWIGQQEKYLSSYIDRIPSDGYPHALGIPLYSNESLVLWVSPCFGHPLLKSLVLWVSHYSVL